MNDKLTFEEKVETIVKLGGRIIGKIKPVKGGYQYTPKDSKHGGDVFKSKGECIHSLYDLS